MSYQYDRYLEQHKANVAKGFRWLQKYLPAITEGSSAEHNTIFAHDASKLNPDEYKAYDAYFYGKNKSYQVVQDFNRAWLLHIHRNPHHWQHWILINDDPKESTICLEIPYCYIVEMICDWWSFSWKENNLYGIFSWYDQRKNYIQMDLDSKQKAERILNQIRKKLEEQGYAKER